LIRAFRDEPHLARVGDHHATDMGPDHLGDRAGVASRLHDDVVVVRQRLGKRRQVIARHANPAQTPGRAVLQQHRLGEDAVDVQSYDPHELASSCVEHGSWRATRHLRIRARSASGRAAGAAK